MPVEYFDVKNWIKNYFGLGNNSTVFENINNSLEFILVWSVFENKYLKDSKDFKSYNEQLTDFAKAFPLVKLDINTIYGFFYNRFIQHKKITPYYKDLGLKGETGDTVRKILKNQKPTDLQKLTLILLIIYKFRCNLFHGRKDPLLLKEFDDVFFNINKFLANLLDKKWTATKSI